MPRLKEVALGRVRGCLAANILVCRVVTCQMLGKLVANLDVVRAFIGRQLALAGDIGGNKRHNVPTICPLNVEGTDGAAALDQAQHGALVADATADLATLFPAPMSPMSPMSLFARAYVSKNLGGRELPNDINGDRVI